MNIDAKLLKACMQNKRKAQNDLYKSCFGLLMGVCVRYKNNQEDARAILNQGFLKILTNLEKYDPKVPFEAWAKRIMINTIIDEFRRSKKEREHVEYTNFEDYDSLKEPVDYNAADQLFDAEAIEALIKMLPPMTQQVFNLYVVDGFSHKEIAKMLEISDGTSKWHLSSARSKLQLQLKTIMATVKQRS